MANLDIQIDEISEDDYSAIENSQKSSFEDKQKLGGRIAKVNKKASGISIGSNISRSLA